MPPRQQTDNHPSFIGESAFLGTVVVVAIVAALALVNKVDRKRWENTVIEQRVITTTITQSRERSGRRGRTRLELCAVVEGKTLCASTPKADWLPVGQRVRAHYGRTRGGYLKVERFEPLPPAKKSP